MYVLVVEDEDDFIDELREIFADQCGAATVEIARSKASAIELLSRRFFDLIVLDLKIPTIDGALDADPKHGHAVFARSQAVVPGTPVFILTGSPAEDFIPMMLRQTTQVDIWGQGQKTGNIQSLRKIDIDQWPELLRHIIDGVAGLMDVELIVSESELSTVNDRLIRIFARRCRGVSCRVSLLGGGLSEAIVARLHLTDATGALVHDAIAKLGSVAAIRSEGERFDRLVARLDPSATPRKLATLEFGAGGWAGNFYGLAKGFESSAFDVACNQDGLQSSAIRSVRVATGPWRERVAQSRRSVGEVRRRLLPDDVAIALAREFRLDWVTEFEARVIQTVWTCVHGDLHGSNILVAATGAIVIIDYGDVGDGPTSLDPVTLELSLMFHPQGPLKGFWPSPTEAYTWGDVSSYIEACPAAEFIRECRSWAEETAAGRREIAASAYAYLLRQLKYKDTDKGLALSLLEGVRAFFNKT